MQRTLVLFSTNYPKLAFSGDYIGTTFNIVIHIQTSYVAAGEIRTLLFLLVVYTLCISLPSEPPPASSTSRAMIYYRLLAASTR
jgi:hypothetical protein